MFRKLVFAATLLFASSLLNHGINTAQAQSLSFQSTPPTLLHPGDSYTVSLTSSLSEPGIVAIQLFDPSWNVVLVEWKSIGSGTRNTDLSFTVPANSAEGSGFIWQGLLFDNSWNKEKEIFQYDVSVGSSLSFRSSPPTTIAPGSSHVIELESTYAAPGIVAIQLFDPSWNQVRVSWGFVDAGTQSKDLNFTLPTNTAAGGGYIWQALLFDRSWGKKKEIFQYNVTVSGGGPVEVLPPGNWALDWNEEFDGPGELTSFTPFLGYTVDEYNNDEKGIRWTTDDPASAQMYSTRTGNHWLDGSGNLVLQAVSKTNEITMHGPKVETAYLMTGQPVGWDPDPAYQNENARALWGGKFFSPADGPLYLSCRVRSDQIKGYSTWFAFWLFTQTRAYNSSNPDGTGLEYDGTEVDIVEIPKGQPSYMSNIFNVANHWGLRLDGSTKESKQFNGGSVPKASDLVNVNDSEYHTWGLKWSQTEMKCYIDGIEYYTFDPAHIPTDPVDMMMLLTLEFEVNAWDQDQGDGRFEGPFISEQNGVRVMTRAFVDYVRVYKEQ